MKVDYMKKASLQEKTKEVSTFYLFLMVSEGYFQFAHLKKS